VYVGLISLFLPARRYASAGTSYAPVYARLCPLHVGVLWKRMDGLIWFLARRLLSTSLIVCCKEILISTKRVLRNVYLNSRLRKVRHGISIVETFYQLSLTKMDAQRVINWTVVGQLN